MVVEVPSPSNSNNSTSIQTDPCDGPLAPSASSSQLSSASDISFKSISSNNNSFKVRKSRPKSDTNLFRDALQKSRKNMSLNKSENNTSGGSSRNEGNQQRNKKTKGWKFVDLCTWIGMKSSQSITGILRDPPLLKEECVASLKEEVRELRNHLREVDDKMQDQLKKMAAKMDELEGRLRAQATQCRVPTIPPPPPPLPPTPRLRRSITLPRCGSAPLHIAGPPFIITPEDIANVKLRKAKDNPLRSKPQLKSQQPLVTQQMLQSTRAKLGRAKPVAAFTPKQQLGELEKCLLQDSWVSSLFRRRVTRRRSLRRAEELRARPFPVRASRSPRSPRSPRSSSLPRGPIQEA